MRVRASLLPPIYPGVGKPVNPPALGAGERWFKSSHPDQFHMWGRGFNWHSTWLASRHLSVRLRPVPPKILLRREWDSRRSHWPSSIRRDSDLRNHLFKGPMLAVGVCLLSRTSRVRFPPLEPNAAVAKSGIAQPCHGWDRGFKSRLSLQLLCPRNSAWNQSASLRTKKSRVQILPRAPVTNASAPPMAEGLPSKQNTASSILVTGSKKRMRDEG